MINCTRILLLLVLLNKITTLFNKQYIFKSNIFNYELKVLYRETSTNYTM